MRQWLNSLAVEPLDERALPAAVNPTFLASFAAANPEAFTEFVQDNSALFAAANPGLYGFFAATDAGDFSNFFGDFGGLFAAAQNLAAFPPVNPTQILAAAAQNATVFPAFAGSDLGDFQDFFDASRQFFPPAVTAVNLFTNDVLANLATVNPTALVTQFAAVNPTLLAGFAGFEADDYQSFVEDNPLFAALSGVRV